jgi:hypothetical protein
MLSARWFSLNRLVAVTLPQVGINDKKKAMKKGLKPEATFFTNF